jgi:FlaA1/EpsC-like NDP-sugar epimerase
VRADWTFAAVDVFLVTMAYVAASAFRLLDPGASRQEEYWDTIRLTLPFLILIHIAGNVVAGAYGHVWKYASIAEARRVIIGNVMAGVVIVGTAIVAGIAAPRSNPIPLDVLVMGASFTVIGMGAVRFRSRLFSFNRVQSEAGIPRVLIVGVDAGAARFAQSDQLVGAMELVGFIDPHDSPEPRRIAGRPILGSLALLRDVVRTHQVDQVVIADPDDATRRSVVDSCLDNDVRLSLLPDIGEMVSGKNGIRDPRDLEIADLLPRPAVDMDLAQVAGLLRGRRVLITGAGGSIGSEILRQVMSFSPESVIAVDNDESHLHDAMLTLEDAEGVVHVGLCDVRDHRRLDEIFTREKPQVVFHAAAHKHVPVLEQHPQEAIKTNVIGTANVIERCRQHGTEQFVLISTDKAVAPANVMGATKRVAEMLIQAASSDSSSCVFTAVRFGNVLGSRGSVVPTFVSQIQRGGPVTITDPDMTRYFMTIREAVQLVLQAASMASGGEVYVLDMGEPVRIIDLAHRMIRLAGLVPGRDIGIDIVGRRPGEKLTESLSLETLQRSPHARVWVTQPRLSLNGWSMEDAVDAFRNALETGDEIGMQALLYRLVEMADAPTDDEIHPDSSQMQS